MGEARMVGNVRVHLDSDGRVEGIELSGRPLYLTRDPESLRRQLRGESLSPAPQGSVLIPHVSTDAIIRANPDCYYYDERLGDRVLRSLGGGGFIHREEIRKGGFALLFAGEGWGEGSSREVAALALLYAGIGAVCSSSMAPIHRRNLINNGMFPISDRRIADRLVSGERLPVEAFWEGLDPLSRRIMKRGGYFRYLAARTEGEEPETPIDTPMRPMTIVEKIMASGFSTRNGAVRPGDSGFLKVDVAFSHDYTTAPAAAQVESALGRPVRVLHPERIHAFPDHLTLAPALPGVSEEAIEGIRNLRWGQKRLADRTGIRLHESASGGSRGICHTVVREEIALPGQVLLGTDSHTCSAGALNCLAYGIGNTEIASIWESGKLAARVPHTIRVELSGRLNPFCMAKDVVLELARVGKESGLFTGTVMEFGGPGLATLDLREQAVLANMAVECNAITAVMEPTDSLLAYLGELRGFDRKAVEEMLVVSDEDARYAAVIELDLGKVGPLVARPGHPGNGVPLREVRGTPVDLAYGGSCTAGDLNSIQCYARVIEGRRVKVPMFVQYGSERVRDEARRLGLHARLEGAGVTVIQEPGCGACINAGPGGPLMGQVAISATNRNMPGRMGEGHAWLANPLVVAASAVEGKISGPEDLS